MSKIRYIKILIVTLIGFLFVRCTDPGGKSGRRSEDFISGEKSLAVAETSLPASDEIAVTPPPFSEGIFPCSDCHKDLKPNPVRRELKDMHDSISAIFNHDKQNRWCLDCHDLNNRDSLRLASGKLLDFRQSYKLCGQCHGDKLRDWKVGVHGKRTGEWNGQKQYYLCVSCHNPHSPKFPKLKPEPAPVRIDEINK
jgi:uncharacterized CHY-type Zn-finger protein